MAWFPDTGANQHVTPDLATLTDSAPYHSNDYLHVDDGKGLGISHIILHVGDSKQRNMDH